MIVNKKFVWIAFVFDLVEKHFIVKIEPKNDPIILKEKK